MKKLSLIISIFLCITLLMSISVSAQGITENIERTYELENNSLSNTYTITTTDIEVKADKYNYPKDYNYYSIIQTSKGIAIIYSKEKIEFTYFSGTTGKSLIADKQDNIILIPFNDYSTAEEFLKGHYTKAQCFKETTKNGDYIRLIHSMNYEKMLYSTNIVLNETKTLEDFKDTRETKTIGGLTASQIFKDLSNELITVFPIVLVTICGYIALKKGYNFVFNIIMGG